MGYRLKLKPKYRVVEVVTDTGGRTDLVYYSFQKRFLLFWYAPVFLSVAEEELEPGFTTLNFKSVDFLSEDTLGKCIHRELKPFRLRYKNENIVEVTKWSDLKETCFVNLSHKKKKASFDSCRWYETIYEFSDTLEGLKSKIDKRKPTVIKRVKYLVGRNNR